MARRASWTRANSRPGSFCSAGGNGGDRARGQRPVGGGDARFGERHFVGAGERRGAQRRPALLGVEQPVGAIFVVGAGQQRGESLERLGFAPGVEIVVAPQRRDDRRRLVAAAGLEQRARQGELAGRRARRIAGETRRHDFGRRMVGVEAPLRDRADPVAARPMRVGGGEGGEALVVGPRREPQGQPVEGGALGRVGRLGGERVAAGEIALAIEDGGRGERRAVEARRRRRRIRAAARAPRAGAATGVGRRGWRRGERRRATGAGRGAAAARAMAPTGVRSRRGGGASARAATTVGATTGRGAGAAGRRVDESAATTRAAGLCRSGSDPKPATSNAVSPAATAARRNTIMASVSPTSMPALC